MTPPDALIDHWGDLQIPWTAKARMIAHWGAANSGLASHVRAASTAMICGKHDRVTAELEQAMRVVEAIEAGACSQEHYDHACNNHQALPI